MKNNSDRNGICFITFSNNYDHQEAAFSMFNALYPEYNVYSIGINNPKYLNSPIGEHSFYFDCPKRPGITKGTFNFKELKKIIKVINKTNVKYVYFESSHIWNAFVMRKLAKGIKSVQVIHDVIPHSDSRGMTLCNKVTTKLADYIVLKNKKFEEELKRIYKVKQENIIYLPIIREFPAFETKDCKRRSFLFFGRIRKYKGLDALISIISQCKDVDFVVVGEPDEESKSLVSSLKEMSNVTVVDREVSNEEMVSFFKHSTAVLLPYSSATQSGVVVDAYKYGCPVIAFDVGAISEQVQDNLSGFLVKAGDIDGVIDKIKYVQSLSSEELSELQANAYEFGLKMYSAEGNKHLFVERFLNKE